jgi:hypothetical protein
VFVHFASDLDGGKLPLSALSEAEFRGQSAPRAVEWLRTSKGLSFADANTLLAGGDIGQTLLGGRADLSIAEHVSGTLARAWSHAMNVAIFESLTTLEGGYDEPNVLVVIIENDPTVTQESFQDVLLFLGGGEVPGNAGWLLDRSGYIKRRIPYMDLATVNG